MSVFLPPEIVVGMLAKASSQHFDHNHKRKNLGFPKENRGFPKEKLGLS